MINAFRFGGVVSGSLGSASVGKDSILPNPIGGWRKMQKPVPKMEYNVEFPDEDSGNDDTTHVQLTPNNENILALRMGACMSLKRKSCGNVSVTS